MDNNEKALDKLELKMDKQEEKLHQVDLSITEIKLDLRQHMARTHAVEQSNELLREYIDVVKDESDKRLGKLEKIKDRFHFLGWLLATGLSAFEAIHHFL